MLALESAQTFTVRGRTESAESLGEGSVALSDGEVGCVEAGDGGLVLGDRWPVETLFSEGLT